VGDHGKPDLSNIHYILSFGLTLVERIVPTAPIFLQIRSAFEN